MCVCWCMYTHVHSLCTHFQATSCYPPPAPLSLSLSLLLFLLVPCLGCSCSIRTCHTHHKGHTDGNHHEQEPLLQSPAGGCRGTSEGRHLVVSTSASIHQSIYPSISPSIHPSIHPSINISIHPSMYSPFSPPRFSTVWPPLESPPLPSSASTSVCMDRRLVPPYSATMTSPTLPSMNFKRSAHEYCLHMYKYKYVSFSHVHTHTHTRTHARTHAHTHTQFQKLLNNKHHSFPFLATH